MALKISMNFIFILLISHFSIGQEKKDCIDFKNGKFTFPLAKEGSGYAIRQDNIQTSYVSVGEIQYVWNVKWVDECHYTLTLIESNDEMDIFLIGDIIEVEINSFKNNCYGYKAILKLNPNNKYQHRKEFYDMMCKEDEM